MKRILLVVFPLLISCVKQDDSWFLTPPNDFAQQPDANIIYCEISDDKKEQYLYLLEENAILPITTKTATNLCGQKSLKDKNLAGLTPFVTRSLYFNEYNGSYQYKLFRDNLWINHNSLAGKNAKISKGALILFLKNKPRNIYVTAYFDE